MSIAKKVKIERQTSSDWRQANKNEYEQIVTSITKCDTEGDITFSRLRDYVFTKNGLKGIVCEGNAAVSWASASWYEKCTINGKSYLFVNFKFSYSQMYGMQTYSMQIFATFPGRSITLHVKNSMSIYSIRQIIYCGTSDEGGHTDAPQGIPPPAMCLTFNGKQLDDDGLTLAQYNIKEGITIQLFPIAIGRLCVRIEWQCIGASNHHRYIPMRFHIEEIVAFVRDTVVSYTEIPMKDLILSHEGTVFDNVHSNFTSIQWPRDQYVVISAQRISLLKD